jgi:hypothetical protein
VPIYEIFGLKCSIASKEYTYLNVKVRKNSTQLIVGGGGGGEFLDNRVIQEQGWAEHGAF